MRWCQVEIGAPWHPVLLEIQIITQIQKLVVFYWKFILQMVEATVMCNQIKWFFRNQDCIFDFNCGWLQVQPYELNTILYEWIQISIYWSAPRLTENFLSQKPWEWSPNCFQSDEEVKQNLTVIRLFRVWKSSKKTRFKKYPFLRNHHCTKYIKPVTTSTNWYLIL